MKLTHHVLEVVPRHVFRTARNTSASSEIVVVELASGDLTGLGEAAPSRFYGEDAGTVIDWLEHMRPAVEDCLHESELMALLTSHGGTDHPSARASLEIAAHDMLGRRLGVPLYEYFELDPARTPTTTVSIGLDEPDEMVRKALEVAGFPLLKIKLSSTTGTEVVRRIREETGADVTVDANCGWSREEAVERAAELSEIGVLFIEQPVAADDVEGLAHVRERSGVPVYADESCPTSAELERVSGAVDGIVIKLMKCGGLIEAVRMARTARERGLGTMIGCMLESSLALTAAAHISPLVDYADLDSGFLLREDPFVGMTIDHGTMRLPGGPGLGVTARTGGSYTTGVDRGDDAAS
ncbi:MAG: dipeptide epimerase [Candidatus Eisenbacteria bacterium]|nr:dipeptide epimerase [Candidatus Eisenbacteria bacterium]